jgi:hypothetical protein
VTLSAAGDAVRTIDVAIPPLPPRASPTPSGPASPAQAGSGTGDDDRVASTYVILGTRTICAGS